MTKIITAAPQKKVQQNLAETILSALPVGALCTKDADALHITFVSKTVERWTGLPAEKFTGTESLFSLVIHPEDRYRAVDALKSITPDTSEFSIAYRLTHKHGNITWVKQKLVTEACPDLTGQHLFLLTDITAEKESQLAFSQAEERYRLFFQRGPLAIMCIDRHGFVIDCNDKLVQLAGMKKNKVIGSNTLSSKFPHLRDFSREVLRGRDIKYQGEYTIPGGNKRVMVSINAFPIRNEEGSVVGGYAFIEDISNRAELEKILDKERDFHRLTIEAAGILVAEVDGSGRLIRINKTMKDMFALSEDEDNYKGSFFWDLFLDPTSRNLFIQDFQKAASTGRTSVVDAQAVGNGNKKFQISWKICRYSSCFSENEQQHVHLIIVGTDISSQRRLEEQIREIQKMDAIGRLAGGVAHDFNNQLTAILGYCQMLLMDADPESSTSKQLRIIEKAAKRASETTNQLLAFSRKQALQPKKILLNQAVRDSSRLFERLLGDNIILKFDLAPEDLMVEVDPGRFQQVLLNLAINARDAMEDGGSITIKTRLLNRSEIKDAALHKEGIFASIQVRDTGCGMEPEVLEKAFEPFFTTKPLGQGTGLGLAMVYGTIKQSGGHVFLESKPGEGTMVNIVLPLTKKDLTVGNIPDDIDTIYRAKPGQLVMLVEDEELVKVTVSDFLKRLGFDVALFSNAEQAVEYLKSPDAPIPSLLITDVVMPGTSGLALADEIKKLIPDLPVLFMSGYSQEVVEKQGILPDKIPFLSKPFTIARLSRMLKALLEQV